VPRPTLSVGCRSAVPSPVLLESGETGQFRRAAVTGTTIRQRGNRQGRAWGHPCRGESGSLRPSATTGERVADGGSLRLSARIRIRALADVRAAEARATRGHDWRGESGSLRPRATTQAERAIVALERTHPESGSGRCPSRRGARGARGPDKPKGGAPPTPPFVTGRDELSERRPLSRESPSPSLRCSSRTRR